MTFSCVKNAAFNGASSLPFVVLNRAGGSIVLSLPADSAGIDTTVALGVSAPTRSVNSPNCMGSKVEQTIVYAPGATLGSSARAQPQRYSPDSPTMSRVVIAVTRCPLAQTSFTWMERSGLVVSRRRQRDDLQGKRSANCGFTG